MKIISWNVNGLRANITKGGFDWLLNQNADIFCVQETKAHKEQLPPEIISPSGYVSYFDHSKTKKGYSGVAIFIKSHIKVEKVEYGFGIDDLDQEGRQITLFFKGNGKKLAFINTYFPNGGGAPERLDYKLRYYNTFLKYVEKIRENGHSVVFTGDVNVAHKEIDIARPKENENTIGFLPIERAWVDKVVSSKFVDVFRHLYPTKIGDYTYWDMKTFARERNVGWRIDYFFVSDDLLPDVKKMEILSDILGSDHCPIFLNIAI